ncbi:hypothetical protein IEQ34_004394 [Dendrobium chrysotoxum]|uniref:Uncharacterized protein n=1 Tax=Dendrobium chrysotoxum TaxID=161865 RepID=A0AAV7HDX1_DENCH|nr:hypothetical protein IEQ34_004394 [Dendrobium chrysotoxum]
MDEFPPFCAFCKCIGHSKGDCHPHPSSALINIGINSVIPSVNLMENAVEENVVVNVDSLDHNALPAPVNMNESTQVNTNVISPNFFSKENAVFNVESLDNNSSLNDSPTFHEKQGELEPTFSIDDFPPLLPVKVGEVNNCLVNLIASPLASPCAHVDASLVSSANVCVDEAAISNDFVPQEFGECVVVPSVGELVNVDCGDVGNAVVSPVHFSTSSSVGFDPTTINVVSPVGELDAAPCNRDVEDFNGALYDRTVVGDVVIPPVNLALTSAFVVSNEELKAHLDLSVSNSSLDHSDWLDESPYLVCGGAGVDVGVLANDF